ncbi:hypothetical protein MXAN_7480 [Myxococcus xanthus DK 1622]|uniref:Uncharacterized protein n=1 Tax=Myxococcus xanthus (strain DK1622) TaxID=246197 RepID=Q1CVJ1_MYXXD|nr:hypothetical protein MXAN_7480 [Myxococcus xanthus DK 1622]QZZ55065.1 hypothetical protein MyxoNM_38515 [Myxococcus xanthus]SDX40679.1 hypothetical protein SAMN05444383_107342 [Myxococcus xanthus]
MSKSSWELQRGAPGWSPPNARPTLPRNLHQHAHWTACVVGAAPHTGAPHGARASRWLHLPPVRAPIWGLHASRSASGAPHGAGTGWWMSAGPFATPLHATRWSTHHSMNHERITSLNAEPSANSPALRACPPSIHPAFHVEQALSNPRMSSRAIHFTEVHASARASFPPSVRNSRQAERMRESMRCAGAPPPSPSPRSAHAERRPPTTAKQHLMRRFFVPRGTRVRELAGTPPRGD